MQNSTIEFYVKLNLRCDWSEMDVFGHINNVAILKYVQTARVNYWEKIMLLEYMNLNKAGPMLASTTCQFKKPLFYPGNITLQSRMEFIKTTSFGLHHQLIDVHGDIAAEAKDVIVMYNFDKNEKIMFPVELRKKVEKIEGHHF